MRGEVQFGVDIVGWVEVRLRQRVRVYARAGACVCVDGQRDSAKSDDVRYWGMLVTEKRRLKTGKRRGKRGEEEKCGCNSNQHSFTRPTKPRRASLPPWFRAPHPTVATPPLQIPLSRFARTTTSQHWLSHFPTNIPR
jgi:hypothetical protein